MGNMRKGFFHVLEVIIVVMLVFVILMQLQSVPKANEPWDMAKLNAMSNDLLYSLEAKGVDWFDGAEVNRSIYYILPRTMGYSVTIRQDVRPNMTIGCVCSASECALLEAMLADFTLNGIPRNFVLTQIAPAGLDLSAGSPQSGNDAVLVCGSPTFTDAQIDGIEYFLSTGRGVVEFSNLSESSFLNNPRWYDEVMNLRWISPLESVNNPSNRAYFPYMDPEERRYPVQKVFFAVPPDATFQDFDNFGTETVYPADGATGKMMVVQKGTYYTGFLDGKEVPLSTIDWGVNGSGRVAWMSNSSIAAGGTDDDAVNAGKLLKSLVIWAASGRGYEMVSGTMSTGAGASMRKAYSGDMYEPVRIDLRIGYHF